MQMHRQFDILAWRTFLENALSHDIYREYTFVLISIL